VRDFFVGLSKHGCGACVLQHALARDLNIKTPNDPNLYLLLGDLHMPPGEWFRSEGPTSPPLNPDIFGQAGADLVRFLGAVAELPKEIKQRLHFIQTGDMFELWVGRDYQFMPGQNGRPMWIDASAPNRVADWAREVLVQNAPSFAAFRRLEHAGLAEVKYLAGNHDAYLARPELSSQLRLPARDQTYRGLSDDLLVEHGHRFDGWNFDKVNGQHWLSGPFLTKLLLYNPDIRSLEPLGGYIMAFTSPPTRDVYLLGATLAYLFERFHVQQKPFSIYAMGHTHARMMLRFDVRATYTGSYHEEGTEGEVRP
jgi:UDP-2,3-diacylglucosamine pyrophosphatase LpxH